jgi:hypothetical protein
MAIAVDIQFNLRGFGVGLPSDAPSFEHSSIAGPFSVVRLDSLGNAIIMLRCTRVKLTAETLSRRSSSDYLGSYLGERETMYVVIGWGEATKLPSGGRRCQVSDASGIETRTVGL